jgi:hypothetical protein
MDIKTFIFFKVIFKDFSTVFFKKNLIIIYFIDKMSNVYTWRIFLYRWPSRRI